MIAAVSNKTLFELNEPIKFPLTSKVLALSPIDALTQTYRYYRIARSHAVPRQNRLGYPRADGVGGRLRPVLECEVARKLGERFSSSVSLPPRLPSCLWLP